jgi:hypothetical protein
MRPLDIQIKIGILLTIVAIFFLVITYSIWTDPMNVEYHNYKFEIDTLPLNNNTIQKFQIYHDFNENKGNISFELYGTDNLDALYLTIPQELIVENISLKNQSKYPYLEKEDYRVDMLQENNIKINFIRRDNITYMTYFELFYSAELTPNAEFEIIPDVSITPPKRDNKNCFFRFSISEEYSCSQYSCYEISTNGLVPQLISIGNDMGIAIDSSIDHIPYSRFILKYNLQKNRISGMIKEIALVLLGAGIGLLLGGITNQSRLRLPQLVLSFTKDGDYVNTLLLEPEIVKIIKKEKPKLKSKTFMSLGELTELTRLSYDLGRVLDRLLSFKNSLPSMWKSKEEYGKEIDEYNKLMRQIPSIDFVLRNEGNEKATDIDITLVFPSDILIIKEDDLPVEPSPPGSDLYHIPIKIRESISNLSDPSIEVGAEGTIISYVVGTLKHTNKIHFSLSISNETPDGEYIIKYYLHCTEYDSTKKEGKLVLKIRKQIREEIEYIDEKETE